MVSTDMQTGDEVTFWQLLAVNRLCHYRDADEEFMMNGVRVHLYYI